MMIVKKPYEPSDPEIMYVESTTPKQCGTCKWFRKPDVCDVNEVGLTIKVHPINGCCNLWNEVEEENK